MKYQENLSTGIQDIRGNVSPLLANFEHVNQSFASEMTWFYIYNAILVLIINKANMK